MAESYIPIDFTLDAFESTVTMDLSGQVESAINVLPDASAIAILYITLDSVKQTFKFATDAVDLLNDPETDVRYYVYSDNWNGTINVANAMMDASAIATISRSDKMMVCHDFIRYLAKELFNTHHGVDLFSNEFEMLQSLRTVCGYGVDTYAGQHMLNALVNVSTQGTHPDMKTDGNGEKYMDDTVDASDNLCRILFKYMLSSDPDRFTLLEDMDTPQSLPFTVGDSLIFTVTIVPAEGQHMIVGKTMEDDPVKPRKYMIKLIVSDDESNNVPVSLDEV